MENTFAFTFSVAMGFFAIQNPFGNTPLFHSFTERFDHKIKRTIALRAVIISFIIVSLFTLSGKLIFKVFGITLPAFQITGGIIAFIIGYQRLHARSSLVHNLTDNEKESLNQAEDISTYPLAIPILAGPGTISTAMSFAGQQHSYTYTVIVVLVYAVMSLLTFLFWHFGEKLMASISPGIMKVITRIMGLLVAVIGVQMCLFGIKNAIELYSKY